MRIHGGSTPEVGQREEGAKPQTTTSTSETSAPDAAPVVVSARAQQLVETGARDAAAHTSKLSALKQKLDSGGYKVDYDKLADKIVTDEIERARKR
jgi:anti-sigma28 factor (negative regulator of flagellin synthesis)